MTSLRFLRESVINSTSDSSKLDFFLFLFLGKGLTVGTIATFRAAPSEPPRRVLGVQLVDRDVAAQIKEPLFDLPALLLDSPTLPLFRVLDIPRLLS